MDVVIPYRSTPGDFELRYAIRSLAGLPHDRVIVAGDKPGFSGVDHVPVVRSGNRYASSTDNILAACIAGTTDKIVVTHDDIFILRPWVFRHEDRGTIADYLRSGAASGGYRAHIVATLNLLQSHGVDDPLFFGLHTPTVYDRDKLVDLIREFHGHAFLLRTLYHNLFPQPSVARDDVKMRRWSSPDRGLDVLSISDRAAQDPRFRRWINERFPHPFEGEC